MRIKEKRMKSFVSRANVLTQAKKQAEAAKAVSDGLQYYSNNVIKAISPYAAEIYEKGVEMALVTICVTAIGTLIIERVARKIYSEIKERYEARIEDRKNGFAYGKYLDNIAYAYGMKRKFFEPDKEFRARILEQIRGI